MIRHGDMMTLDVIGTNALGNGVAKAEDMVVFCRGAVEGDVVTALVNEVKKNYAVADVLKIVTPSSHRCAGKCPYAAECGGCVFDGITYEHELETKKAGIAAAMRREGIRTQIARIIGTANDGYRNKAVFHFNEEGKCGFFKEGASDFVKIEKCLLCDENINIIKNEAERIISEEGLGAENLTYLYIRYMKETDEAAVAVGYTGEGSLLPLAEKLLAGVPSVKCVLRGRDRSPEARSELFELVSGEGRISANVAGLDLSLSPASFFQVNEEGAEKLCEEVTRLADLKDGERAADIYCGTGFFGLSLAKSAPGAEVYGIELNDSAVHDANKNAERNGLKNAFFLQGDSSELKSKTGIDSLDVAVVDPPRTGLSKRTVEELVKLAPERIVCVSCNPSTLARDIKLLSDSYSIKEIVGVDMFPRTKHVETVVLMTKK